MSGIRPCSFPRGYRFVTSVAEPSLYSYVPIGSLFGVRQHKEYKMRKYVIAAAFVVRFITPAAGSLVSGPRRRCSRQAGLDMVRHR